MGWEQRRGCKGRYHTLTVWGKSRCRRIYCGCEGSTGAELASTLMEIAHLQRTTFAQESSRWDALESTLGTYWFGVDFLMRASMVAGGYYKHRRAWRKHGYRRVA